MLGAMQRLIAVAALVLAVLGCGFPVAPRATPSPLGSGGPTNGPTSNATQAPTGPAGEIDLDITGGKHAGSYVAETVNACTYSAAGNKFTVSYAASAADGGFVALDLVVNDAALAQSDETNAFGLVVTMGGASQATTYTIDPANHQGDGTTYLETSTTDATLDLTATAPDGTDIDVTVICGL